MVTESNNQDRQQATSEAPPQEAPTHRTVRFTFNGTGHEYFSIWIVNIFLSIVTLGIYSAWATVRTKRYFLNSTEVDGFTFDFHANPITILKGRIIAAIFFALYALSLSLFPPAAVLFIILFFVLLPWVINRSLSFRHRNTSYRNVRFDFTGTYGDSFWNFILRPILCLLPLGLLLPMNRQRTDAYLVQKTYYGKQAFSSNAKTMQYFWIAVILFILAIIPINILTFLASSGLGPLHFGNDPLLLILVLLAIYVPFGLAALIYHGFRWRILLNTVKYSDLFHVKTNLSVLRFTGQALFSFLLIVCTLGLATPWAIVGFKRYLTESITLVITGDMESVVGDPLKAGSAFGSEAMDFGDIGVI